MPFLIRYSYAIIGVCCLVFNLKAQAPYLERAVTIHAVNKPPTEIFKSISEQAAVVFSYSQTFDDTKITLHCSKKPLRLVLSELQKQTGCQYKLKDKFIILKCGDKPVAPPSVILGYVYNARDSSAIPEASIYIKQSKHSAQSNGYGFFSLSYADKRPDISVSIAKEGYGDSTLVIYNKNKQGVLIYLYPHKPKEETPIHIADSLGRMVKDNSTAAKKDSIIQEPFFNKFSKSFKVFNANFKNISDTLFSDVAVSLIPSVSTNRLLSINTINKFSLNVLAGYSRGISVFELGGLLNTDNGNVQYAQIAGIGNRVSGTSTGAQVAGIFNLNYKDTKGAQAAGIINLDQGGLEGVQVAGIGNVLSQQVRGLQLAGIFNTAGSKVTGVQTAGIYNTASSVRGLQLAGIMNDSDTTDGLQLSAILNRTRNLKGVQVALINLADTSSGLSIGLFSFVKKGYHKLEIGTDELLFGNLAFGFGTKKLYTMFTGGINYTKPSLVTYGYGFGSGFTLKNKLGLCINITAHQIQSTAQGSFQSNLLSKAFVGLEYSFRPKFRITLGPTVNVFSSNVEGSPGDGLYDELPSSLRIYEPGTGNIKTKAWVGAKLSVKFF